MDDRVEAGHRPLDLGLDPLAVSEPVLSPSERVVLDERPAEEFFELPRIGVANADGRFEDRITALYRRVLGPLCDSSSVLLDLCSSWTSHLPPDLQPGQVVGHGMNAEELAANARLSRSFTADLNRTSRLPLPAASVRAALCCNGLQYLSRPEWVMAEVARVLLPGGLVVVSFSDCCWAERATAGWLARSDRERLQLVARVLESAGLNVVELLTDENANDDDGEAAGGGGNSISGTISSRSDALNLPGADPLFAVIAQKPAAAAATVGSERIPLLAAAAADGGIGVITAEANNPGEVASTYVGPALREMDLLRGLEVTPALLERWRLSYAALVDDAKELGIPASAIPALPTVATAEEIRAARDHLQSMIASFLSAGL